MTTPAWPLISSAVTPAPRAVPVQPRPGGDSPGSRHQDAERERPGQRGLAVAEALLHQQQERGERVVEHAIGDGLGDRQGPDHLPAG